MEVAVINKGGRTVSQPDGGSEWDVKQIRRGKEEEEKWA